jgi:phytoene dehydrogenase-like protein
LTLSELADIGELAGGVAVVASLVYLALQVRQNTRAVRGSTLHLNTDLWASLFLRLSDQAVTQAYIAGMSGQPDIKPLHYSQFYFICKTMFLALEDQFYQARQGTLDREIYAAYERATTDQLLAFPGFRIWWLQTRSTFSPSFVARVDEMIATTPESDPRMFLHEWQRLAAERRSDG